MCDIYEVKTLEEMPKALSYLINKVETLQQEVNTLRNKQQVSESPRWMNIDELCAYHPSHPKKQTVYEWVSKKTIRYELISTPAYLGRTKDKHILYLARSLKTRQSFLSIYLNSG